MYEQEVRAACCRNGPRYGQADRMGVLRAGKPLPSPAQHHLCNWHVRRVAANKRYCLLRKQNSFSLAVPSIRLEYERWKDQKRIEYIILQVSFRILSRHRRFYVDLMCRIMEVGWGQRIWE